MQACETTMSGVRRQEALRVDGLTTGYGKKRVLNGVSLDVATYEIVALIGHNGAGKSTLLKAIFGLIPIWKGTVWIGGNPVKSLMPRELVKNGVVYIPQGNRVFNELTVQENMEMGGRALRDRQSVKSGIDRSFSLFPELKKRLKKRAGTLSGGEKQMLAFANGLMSSPRLLLMDEPSLGLAPAAVSVALKRIKTISTEGGVSVLMVEQKVREVLAIAQRVFVLRNGSISFDGPADKLKDDTRLREVFL